jgi:hypothetical protein
MAPLFTRKRAFSNFFYPWHPPLAPATVTLYLALVFASVSYRHCLETERLLMKDIRNPELSPRDRAICANALDRILKRKRLLRRKPAPKPVDLEQKEHQKGRRQAEVQPVTELDHGPEPAPVPERAS